jgi:hypothetical protein
MSHQQVFVSIGVFKKDGAIYVVKPNKQKTRVYAKEIVAGPPRMTENGEVVDFEARYAPGVVYKLTEGDRWDMADARDFLTKFSRCIVCNRHLKAAESVANDIGPVCAKYFAHNKEQPNSNIREKQASQARRFVPMVTTSGIARRLFRNESQNHSNITS